MRQLRLLLAVLAVLGSAPSARASGKPVVLSLAARTGSANPSVAPLALAAGVSLSAPAQNAAPMAPALVVNHAAPAGVPASAVAAPALEAAMVPAAAQQDSKEGSGDADKAAGAVEFDGAVSRAPAPVEPVAAAASAPEAKRSSGLSPPTALDVASAYGEVSPNSALLKMAPRLALAGDALVQLLLEYTFKGEYFLQMFAEQAPQQVYRAAEQLAAVHDSPVSAAARRFLELAGRRLAEINPITYDGRRHLPPDSGVEGEYWDLAAGIHAGGFMTEKEIQPGVPYALVDRSHFVTSFLNEVRERTGSSSVRVVESDVLTLRKPEKPLSVLRAKNVNAYVPEIGSKLEEMSGWIAPGGKLYLQTDPSAGQRMGMRRTHGALAKRLIEEGWGFEFGFTGESSGAYAGYALDTIAFTRPAGAATPRSSVEASRLWESYLHAEQRATLREQEQAMRRRYAGFFR